jgi:hypothetical protein
MTANNRWSDRGSDAAKLTLTTDGLGSIRDIGGTSDRRLSLTGQLLPVTVLTGHLRSRLSWVEGLAKECEESKSKGIPACSCTRRRYACLGYVLSAAKTLRQTNEVVNPVELPHRVDDAIS